MEDGNLTLHTDKYQINMMYAHWKLNRHNEVRVFDAYFRKNPFNNGYAVFAGLERIVHYVESLRFGEEHIAYLRAQPEGYEEGFLDELKRFAFTGSLRTVPEGTVVFPNEPIIRVEARIFEAQLIETALLNFMNYQTLIATKASRIKRVAPNDTLFEFGTRRAQEADAAIWGSRAAYIAGFDGTSNMESGRKFGIPTVGTHAHAWVMDFESELAAFEAFAEVHPDRCVLLVDTYDTLRSGVPNAIKVGKALEAKGHRLKGIRLDSGDLAYLSIQARNMLDEAGLGYVTITASNDLDENVMFDLKAQGARIDAWGIGTQLITAADNPSLGGVYKLVARKEGDTYVPVIKISGNPEKITTPGLKTVYRIVGSDGKSEGDYIAFPHERVKEAGRLKLFDPVHTYLHKYVTDYEAVELLVPVFENGRLVCPLPSLDDIRAYHRRQMDLFWEQYLRKLNPEPYPVDLSEDVWETKMGLIAKHR
ncbi:nicotinate phosphoribosyltransferase [Paenibacillus flagellatus]|uniref:Nicotinate phosphoribosyltransferase n=1 Tax=Paenibacillus flagellatus TaxID=2211139 RepID=A0A2V5JXR6_9BACL|nr:nicotinate phosphoribosyltransferase [Paenibacillus flagellatus]PYI51655.1 nicotinate phosphoribosyltransferase [Paenibacillus flagellatus]